MTESPLTGEKKLSAILNSLWEAVITVDQDHRIASFNRAAERLVGLPEVEVVGKDCRDILKASFGPAQADCPMGDIGEGGVPRTEVAGTLVLPDGRVVPVSASWAFLHDEHGRVPGFVVSFRSFEELERIVEERRARSPFREIVGKTPRLMEIFDLVEAVRDTDSTVLILGESGTGKGLFARAIHDLSPRRDKPFVKLNCAALTETLLESELFGHVRGAFTGAVADKVGRFEAAAGGTVFLDEIGEISPVAAGEAAPRPAGPRVPEGRQQPRSQDRHPGDRGDEPGPAGRDEGGALPGRPVLQAARHPHPGPASPRTEGRHPPSRRPHPQGAPATGARTRKGGFTGGDALPDRLRVAGQREGTGKRPGAGSGGGARGGDHGDRSSRRVAGGRSSPAAGPFRPRLSRPVPKAVEGGQAELLAVLASHHWNRNETAAALGVDRTTLWRRMKRVGLA